MKLEALQLLLGFCALFSSVQCSLPEAVDYDYDYYYDCEDSVCIYRNEYVNIEVMALIGDTQLEIVTDEDYSAIRKRSAWTVCAPNVPLNQTADFFKECEELSKYREISACNAFKQGLINQNGEIDQAKVLETYKDLQGANELIQECLKWDGNYDEDYDYDDYYDDDDYYDYDNYGLEEQPDDVLYLIEPIDQDRKRVIRSAENKRKQNRKRNKRKNRKNRNPKKNGKRSKASKSKAKRGKNKGKNRKGKKGKKGKGKKAKKGKKGKNKDKKKNEKGKEKTERSSLENIGLSTAPTKQTINRVECVKSSLDMSLRDCAKRIILENANQNN